MKRANSVNGRLDNFLGRVPLPRVPGKVEVPYGGLVKTGFWILAFAWFWGAGNGTNVAQVFYSGPDYVRTQQISICRSYQTPTGRSECVTRFLVGSSNDKFSRVAITFLPPLILVPICGRAVRRLGPRARRKVRIL